MSDCRITKTGIDGPWTPSPIVGRRVFRPKCVDGPPKPHLDMIGQPIGTVNEGMLNRIHVNRAGLRFRERDELVAVTFFHNFRKAKGTNTEMSR